MTKEELERIKQAYYSGLKVQIWFNGHWEIFDARDYSMYSDPFSENRLYRIVGSAYADIAEKRIVELEKENAELKSDFIKSCKVKEQGFKEAEQALERKDKQLTKAKEIIRSLYFIIQGRIDYKGNIPLEDEMYRANQFLNSKVSEWQ